MCEDTRPGFTFYWPLAAQLDNNDEAIFSLDTTGGCVLQLASNYPYEVFLDGTFAGDGGHRCVPHTVFVDEWDARSVARVTVHLHWINVQTTAVSYRALFADPFFAVRDDTQVPRQWNCQLCAVIFKAQMCSQLPRQQFVVEQRLGADQDKEVSLQLLQVQRPEWQLVSLPIARARHVRIGTDQDGGLVLVRRQVLAPQRQAKHKQLFQPQTAHDLLHHVLNQRDCALQCVTYDLGAIGLHRFECATLMSACVLCYSEVPDFQQAWLSANRRKVHLADGCAAALQRAILFGHRGCRYVHVLTAKDICLRSLTAWRREYPFDWQPVPAGLSASSSSIASAVYDACKRNLVAVCDGGLVDTCWRERAQWTGDARLSCLALRTLTNNWEVAELVLSQIAESYDAKLAMVSGLYPARCASYHLPMPTFHLAFCLAVLEHQDALRHRTADVHLDTPLLRAHQVVLATVKAWKRKYLHGGLLTKLPGWCFVDWDMTDEDTVGRQGQTENGANAVCHAWWQQLCDKLAIESGLDLQTFDQTFWTERGYRLLPGKALSPHATAALLSSSLPQTTQRAAEAYACLREAIRNGTVRQRLTPYFANFVTFALAAQSTHEAQQFVLSHYGPMAAKHGTIQEKVSDEASLAHGWSIGFVSVFANV